MKFTKRKIQILSVSFIIGAIATTAWSDEGNNNSLSSSTLCSLFDCTDIVSDVDRLLCQDREIQKLREATNSKKLIVIDEKSVEDIKKKSFGFSLPKLGLPEFGSDSSKPETVELAVSSVKNSGRKLTIKMENGQVWQSIESYVGYLPKRGKLNAKIKPASLGSFRMTISNEKSKSKGFTVRRIQ
jgi:hypothetical protein